MRNKNRERPVVRTTVRGSQTTLWGNRDLIWSLAKRDLQARYKSTALGWAWSLIVPLAQLAIYSLVFSVIFRAIPPDFGNGRSGVFAVWLFAGLVVWGLISNSVGRGTASILGARSLLQKIYFPSYVATFAVVIGVAIQSIIEFSLLLVVLAVLFANVGWTWLLLPFLFLGLLVFSACLSCCFAIANVYFRDVSQAVPVILQFTFFLSAIIYPLVRVPEEGPLGLPLQTLIGLNPVAQFVQVGRDLLYELQIPSLGVVLYLLSQVGPRR
jgi:ABC-type polysaccharide/polyol phosphate export permease